MPDDCCDVEKAGASFCELPSVRVRPMREKVACPQCGQLGKPVPGQTVRSLVAVSLRMVAGQLPILSYPRVPGGLFP